MAGQGWVSIYRELLDKSIWLESTPEQKTILITLLLMANHAPKNWEWNGQLYEVQPGQFVTSLDSIAQKAGKQISIKNVRTAINRFEKLGFLANESTNRNRLITIINWGFYQGDEGRYGKQPDKQTASNGQADGKQPATNNNVNNDNNVNNKDSAHKKRARSYPDDDPNKKLANLLYKGISGNSEIKKPNLNKWANTIRLMIERDHRTGKEVQDMILWSTQDEFWSAVILSADSLRRNYDKMHVQMIQKSSSQQPAKPKKYIGDAML
ncbi:hypothetical protein [Enterococcus dispar]|uniref:hypothetical protein n=1 Tax=Enterococcus dispar TaxID=44009 RepID=UPI002491B30A|nr:hypothetical protein [Enterococcus dispar]